MYFVIFNGSVHLTINLYLEDVLSLFMNTRNRASSEYIGYGLYFYFSGLSLRKTSERLSSCFIKREKSYINQSGIGYKQKYKPKKIFERKRKKIKEFIIDETLIIIGSELIDMALGCYYRIWRE